MNVWMRTGCQGEQRSSCRSERFYWYLAGDRPRGQHVPLIGRGKADSYRLLRRVIEDEVDVRSGGFGRCFDREIGFDHRFDSAFGRQAFLL